MKETRTINLNGLVYHIDYDAHHILHDYLQDIELRLPQEDRQEVMNDIEARIAELFQKALFAKNVQVVSLEMVNSVKSQIGDPSEFGPNRRPKVKIDKARIAEEIVSKIESLPEIYRDVLILKYLQELDNKEIADILNIKATTVRKRLERAKFMLAELLEKDGEYDDLLKRR